MFICFALYVEFEVQLCHYFETKNLDINLHFGGKFISDQQSQFISANKSKKNVVRIKKNLHTILDSYIYSY